MRESIIVQQFCGSKIVESLPETGALEEHQRTRERQCSSSLREEMMEYQNDKWQP